MDEASSVKLDEGERNELLERGGTGVISFTTGIDEPPYSLPVSYGYDETNGHFYFHLADGTGTKWDVMQDGDLVSFVTFDRDDGDWWSVVATGTLEGIPEDTVDPVVAEAMRRVQIPLFDVFDAPTRELTFRFFRLDPDDVTGRKEVYADG